MTCTAVTRPRISYHLEVESRASLTRPRIPYHLEVESRASRSLLAMRLQAGSLQKAYFAATHPGTWAKYESSWEMPDGMAGINIYTYIRASDSADRLRIEIDTETLAVTGEGMISRQLFVMEPGFDLAKDFLNHMMFVEASIAQTGNGTPSLMQDNVVEIIRESAGDVTNSVTFKGQATIGGRDCDHYGYSYKFRRPARHDPGGQNLPR